MNASSFRLFYPKDINEQQLNRLSKSNPNLIIKDLVQSGQLDELAKVLAPTAVKKTRTVLAAKYADEFASGTWVHTPWHNQISRIVDEVDYLSLMTNRNRELITKVEQTKLYNSTIGIVGLSVGAGVAKALVRSGASQHIKIADFDSIEATNMNRLDVSFVEIGQTKLDSLCRQMLDVNPYIQIHQFGEGLKDENIDSFFSDEKKLDLIIDEIDDFQTKLKIRQKAREYSVPVMMMTSLGDNLLVDVERYDKDGQVLFNGVFGQRSESEIERIITNGSQQELAVILVDKKHVPKRALGSLGKIGHTLVGRPQLFSTVSVGAGLGVFLAKRLLLEILPSGRYFINFPRLFSLDDDFDGQMAQTVRYE
ncbi:MAG TPA: ThiF family adenylyltransferase [Candidatus Saccharimonadales bacterium]